MAGFYNAEELAADAIWKAQRELCAAVRLVEQMGRLDHKVVVENGDEADKIVIQGAELARTMRAFALRIDRTVATRN